MNTSDTSRILDDLTRVAGGALNVFSTLGKQIQSNLKDQIGEKFQSSAPNDDVVRLQGVVAKLRLEQEDLKARIAALEALLGQTPAAKPKKAAPKAAPKAASKAAPKPAAKTAPKSKTAKPKKRV